jgi:hypothetical protein
MAIFINFLELIEWHHHAAFGRNKDQALDCASYPIEDKEIFCTAAYMEKNEGKRPYKHLKKNA